MSKQARKIDLHGSHAKNTHAEQHLKALWLCTICKLAHIIQLQLFDTSSLAFLALKFPHDEKHTSSDLMLSHSQELKASPWTAAGLTARHCLQQQGRHTTHLPALVHILCTLPGGANAARIHQR